jgi:ankyrin repeat protein
MNKNQIFEAAKNGDLKTINDCIKAGADLDEKNEYGFNALHCAAMGANTTEISKIIPVLHALIESGCSLESLGGGGRTPLYLAAEFSQSIEPIQILLDAGANPNIYDEYGNHIVKNSMLPEVQQLLSKISGEPIPKPPTPKPTPIKMSGKQWRKTKGILDIVFSQLSKDGLIALQDAGNTQDDGFTDCSEEFIEKGGINAGLHGFCFYTRQDLNRAKKSSHLTLGFWGAPEGEPKDMIRVGNQIVETFKKFGFAVDWDGSSNMRPTVSLLIEDQ